MKKLSTSKLALVYVGQTADSAKSKVNYSYGDTYYSESGSGNDTETSHSHKGKGTTYYSDTYYSDTYYSDTYYSDNSAGSYSDSVC